MIHRHPYLHVPHPMVLAHQGDSEHAPSNTLDAFRRAVDVGCDALELDIHWTRDDVIVVSHDATVDRMSNGHGAIREMTLAELRQLDFGYRYTVDEGQTFPYRGMGVRIPTLREVLETFPTTRVNMDIKPRKPGSLKPLLVDIDACSAFNRVLIASFHHAVLAHVRQVNTELATSASPIEVAKFRLLPVLSGNGLTKYPFLALQVPAMVGQIPLVTASFLAKAHASGIHVHVWTVDQSTEMNRLLAMGVDGIVTNRPETGVQIRDAFLDLQQVKEG